MKWLVLMGDRELRLSVVVHGGVDWCRVRPTHFCRSVKCTGAWPHNAATVPTCTARYRLTVGSEPLRSQE